MCKLISKRDKYLMKIFINTINKTLLTFCAFIISFVFATAIPVPAKFFVNTFEADVGQTVEFELKVEGSESVPVYTVITNLEYDKNLLTYKGTTVQSGWVTVPPDDVTDTANGVIKRTAGYPAGLKQIASVYKYTFVAKAPGDAKVNVLGSSAYDANNNDLGLQNKTITVKIGGKKEVEPVVEPVKTTTLEPSKVVAVAKKPQTLTTEFAGQIGFDVTRDYTFVLKHNLKVTQETIGSSTISALDATGNKVWSQVKDFTFTDSSEMLATIPANTLQPGNYTLTVDTVHDNQKTPVTLSKEIGGVPATEKIVTKEVPKPFIPLYMYFVTGFMFLLWLLTFIYQKSKKFRKFLKNF